MNQYTTTPSKPSLLHDQNGNLADVNAGALLLNYDYRNRLVQFFRSDIAQTTTYRYDCLGRRIEKNEAGSLTRFYYDGADLIEEQDGTNISVATYVYSKGAHTRLQMKRGGQKYFYHEDDLGSVMKVTNAVGTVVEQYEYGDFGTTKFFDHSGNPLGGSSIGNPFLFTGYFFDAESDFYCSLTRYLDPSAGRFISRDIIGIWGDCENLGNGFSYVGNNPLSYIDPFGLAACNEWFKVKKSWVAYSGKPTGRTGESLSIAEARALAERMAHAQARAQCNLECIALKVCPLPFFQEVQPPVFQEDWWGDRLKVKCEVDDNCLCGMLPPVPVRERDTVYVPVPVPVPKLVPVPDPKSALIIGGAIILIILIDVAFPPAAGRHIFGCP